jgi:hypothetical protein
VRPEERTFVALDTGDVDRTVVLRPVTEAEDPAVATEANADDIRRNARIAGPG